MNNPKIIAYLKPTCGWSMGVRAVLKKYDLAYEDRDIINDPLQRQDCVEIDGHMLADVSGEEVEAFMLSRGMVQPNDTPPEAPTNQACEHEGSQPAPMTFKSWG